MSTISSLGWEEIPDNESDHDFSEFSDISSKGSDGGSKAGESEDVVETLRNELQAALDAKSVVDRTNEVLADMMNGALHDYAITCEENEQLKSELDAAVQAKRDVEQHFENMRNEWRAAMRAKNELVNSNRKLKTKWCDLYFDQLSENVAAAKRLETQSSEAEQRYQEMLRAKKVEEEYAAEALNTLHEELVEATNRTEKKSMEVIAALQNELIKTLQAKNDVEMSSEVTIKELQEELETAKDEMAEMNHERTTTTRALQHELNSIRKTQKQIEKAVIAERKVKRRSTDSSVDKASQRFDYEVCVLSLVSFLDYIFMSSGMDMLPLGIFRTVIVYCTMVYLKINLDLSPRATLTSFVTGVILCAFCRLPLYAVAFLVAFLLYAVELQKALANVIGCRWL